MTGAGGILRAATGSGSVDQRCQLKSHVLQVGKWVALTKGTQDALTKGIKDALTKGIKESQHSCEPLEDSQHSCEPWS